MSARGCGYGAGFALLVVLFILLIIIGASYLGCGGYGAGYGAGFY
ncbi:MULTISPECIES: YjcZ family sporulation protein [Bacillaceae]